MEDLLREVKGYWVVGTIEELDALCVVVYECADYLFAAAIDEVVLELQHAAVELFCVGLLHKIG
jgi:hypothetical protein